jgi:DNA repair protein RecO (recombination protein O)
MIRKTRGIVLHTTRYGDSSLIIHCYTEQYGKQTYMVKGVRKSRKDNRSNLFQPLFILDFEVYHKDTREIQLVKEVTRSTPINSIPYDITKSTQAIFMAEVLFRVVKEEESNPMLARYLVNSIEYLDALADPDPDYHVIFLFHLSRHLGFYPQNNFSEDKPYFDLMRGQFVSGISDPEIQLNETASRLWSDYLKADFQESRNPGFNSKQRITVLDQLMKYYKYHVEGMGDIRSLDVLHDFFHNQ